MSDPFVEAASFLQFHQTVGYLTLSDTDEPGCSWFLSTDRQFAASLYLNAATEQWHYVVYRFARDQWGRSVSRTFDALTDAEDALHRELIRLATWKTVRLVDPQGDNREAADAP